MSWDEFAQCVRGVRCSSGSFSAAGCRPAGSRNWRECNTRRFWNWLREHGLRLKVDALARKLFGKSSEKLEPAQLQISTAGSGTSSNSNAVLTLDTPFADPDAESMRLRFNELLLALRR